MPTIAGDSQTLLGLYLRQQEWLSTLGDREGLGLPYPLGWHAHAIAQPVRRSLHLSEQA